MGSILIIGGGAGGCLVAAQVLRQAKPPCHIVLVERSGAVGRGFAYGTNEPAHLLNVPAGRMGAYPEDLGGFLRWVGTHSGEPGVPEGASAGDFLPRLLYGRYLADTLAEARAAAQPGVGLEVVSGEAIDIEEITEGARVLLNDGRAFAASRVVLALGNLPGEYPIRKPLAFYHGSRYVHVPWEGRALESIGRDDPVLLVGAGLTAIDILVHAEAAGHRGMFHALSRNGLRPMVHRASAPWRDFLAGESAPGTTLGLLRRIRREVKSAAAQGVDWRPVIDAIRPHSHRIWAALDWNERGRFLRHLRPLWEVHRHRVAPGVAESVARMEAAGRLQFHAGRLETLKETPSGVEAVYRRRRSSERGTMHVALVVNCTGPRSDYSKFQHPLLVNLLARGLIDHDPLALGIQALPTGEVLRYRSSPVGWLYTLGAPLKGVLWESTAMPEIRTQARTVAGRLLAGF